MELFLQGNYRDNLTKLEVFRTKKVTHKVFLNVHGLYGLSGDKGSKSKQLGDQILQENLANVVYFSSSRDWNIYDDKDFEKSMLAFKEKTFAQERQDLIDTIDLIVHDSRELFHCEVIRFYVVASSMGGTIISSLSERFHLIDKVVLCGAGTGASSPTKPILSTYPSKEYIIDSASRYRGDVMLLQGSRDQTVPLFSQDELINSYTNASKKLKRVIEGANHNFSSIDGKDKPLAYNIYCEEVLKFLRD